MIIGKTHPAARYLLVLKGGKIVGLVQKVDTDNQMMVRWDRWETFKYVSEVGAPEPMPIIERYDELRYRPEMPGYMQNMLPKGTKPHLGPKRLHKKSQLG